MSVIRRPLLCLLVGLGLLSCEGYAGTTGKIAGKIVDARTKEPLIGVNVVIVGTTLG
jgi:hypothetical protein